MPLTGSSMEGCCFCIVNAEEQDAQLQDADVKIVPRELQ